MTSEWKTVDVLDISSKLSLSDTSYFHDNPLIVDVPSGRYDVGVRVESETTAYGDNSFVTCIRVFASTQQVRRGKQLGYLSVDFAQIGVCDRTAIERELANLSDEQMHLYYDQLKTTDESETTRMTGVVTLPGGGKMVWVLGGIGNGEYAVYEMRDATGVVAGVEVDLTEENEDA